MSSKVLASFELYGEPPQWDPITIYSGRLLGFKDSGAWHTDRIRYR